MARKREKNNKQRNIWNWMDGFRGDKVILIIALLLMLISVISVFSSTPLLALETGVGRIDIMTTQLQVVGIGVVVILLLYIFGSSGLYRWFGKYGFALSLAMLVILVFNLKLGIVEAGEINGARRIIKVFGKQLHVYEFVKVFMILYLAWALDAYKKGEFKLNKFLAALSPKLFTWTTRPLGEKFMYIYFPALLSIGFVASGSNSSALFLSVVLILIILIGGVNFREIALFFASIVVLGGILVLGYKTGIVKSNRIETAFSRITNDDDATMRVLLDSKIGSPEYENARDELRQPVGAKLAIKEGGLLGKGIGNSTQKYAVPVIFGDYMFSFIIEETGFIGAILIILLYFSLLARSSTIAKGCDNYFDKIVVAGLAILVTGQAFMHMMVNVHFPLVPQTGQTLPLVSHGTTSFLVFSAVFGMLLSISRETYLKTKKREEEEYKSIHIEREPADEVEAGVREVEIMDENIVNEEEYGV
jgi:Bacterial cell division membrane protein